jgi:hypothetical protein
MHEANTNVGWISARANSGPWEISAEHSLFTNP